MLKSKIHRAVVTGADLNYEGSLTLDRTLMDQAHILPFERIKIYNISNGERFDTYVIPGSPGSREVCLNGAAAFGIYSPEEIKDGMSTVLVMGPDNQVKEVREHPWST